MGNTLSANVRLFPITENFGMFSGNRPVGAGTATGTDIRSILVPRRYRQHMFFITTVVSREQDSNRSDVQFVSGVGRDGLQWVLTRLNNPAFDDEQTTVMTSPWFWELASDASDDTGILIAAQWGGNTTNKGILCQGVYCDYNSPRGVEVLAKMMMQWLGKGGGSP